jgi:hypothetical protein
MMKKGKFRDAPVVQARRSRADHRGDPDACFLDHERRRAMARPPALTGRGDDSAADVGAKKSSHAAEFS